MKIENSGHHENRQPRHQRSRLSYFVVGLGIGALAGVLFAPQSGDDTREWFATKYKDGMDSVDAKVRQTRQQVTELIEGGQQRVSEAVDKGREAFSKAKAAGV